MPRIIRRPLHQGTWYESDEGVLREQIEQWMNGVDDQKDDKHSSSHSSRHENGRILPQICAIIGPHAGYQYCGQVMAHAYKYISTQQLRIIKRIFILGPSHNVYSDKCLLSSATEQSTPFGNLQVDQMLNKQLMQTGMFEYMPLEVEENEHSLEMHLPYIAYVMEGKQESVGIVPIMVGALTQRAEAEFGRVLAHFLQDEQNLFVISTDFCHWGRRFKYVYINDQMRTISESIEWLDGVAMKIIEQGDAVGFVNYLKQYGNTICGRHPLAVFLYMLRSCQQQFKIAFTDYRQSGICLTMADSSVSYAAAVVSRHLPN